MATMMLSAHRRSYPIDEWQHTAYRLDFQQQVSKHRQDKYRGHLFVEQRSLVWGQIL